MKKHNARKKKVANRVKAHNSPKSIPVGRRIGIPTEGFISRIHAIENKEAVMASVRGFVDGTDGRFFHDDREGTISIWDLEDIDRISISHAIAKSRVLDWENGERAKGSAMFPDYRKHTEDPHWNIGSAGSIWMDVMSDSGNPFRISLVSDSTGTRAFAIYEHETSDNLLSLFGQKLN